MQVRPRHVLCFLGPEGSFGALSAALQVEIEQRAPGFSLDEKFSQAFPDPRMSRSFDVCWDRVHPQAHAAEDEAAVASHGAALYALSPHLKPETAVEISAAALALVDRMLERGATAAKGESAGVAHGAARWRELAAEARGARERGDLLALARACRLAFSRRPLSREGRLASVGFHLAGLPDVEIPAEPGMDPEIAREIDRMGDLMAAEGAGAAAAALAGHLVPDTNYHETELKHNPYGVVVGTRRPAG